MLEHSVYMSSCACLYLCVSGCVRACNRVADKKAAIGYTYEDSGGGVGGVGVDNLDDDGDSSDEDIDLGQSIVTCQSFSASFHTSLYVRTYYLINK